MPSPVFPRPAPPPRTEPERDRDTVLPCRQITVTDTSGVKHDFVNVKYRMENGWFKLTIKTSDGLRSTIFPAESIEKVEVLHDR